MAIIKSDLGQTVMSRNCILIHVYYAEWSTMENYKIMNGKGRRSRSNEGMDQTSESGANETCIA